MTDSELFTQRFADFWASPSPERMAELLHPEVVLIQPLSRPMIGLAAAQDEFRRLFAFLPDLKATVDRALGGDELLYIEFRLHASLGRERIEWPVVDRFYLQDGKALERMTYFDPLPILLRMLRHPSRWWPWWKSGTCRPWVRSTPA